MICPKCKSKIYNADFCEVCGTDVSGQSDERQTDRPAVINMIDEFKMPKISPKFFIGGIILVVIVIGLFLAYNSFKKQYEPSKVVEEYCNYLVAAKYQEAFKLVDGTNNKFLTEKYYIRYMESLSLKGENIVDIKETTGQTSTFGMNAQQTTTPGVDKKIYSVQIGSSIIPLEINKRGKKALFFDEWKISALAMSKPYTGINAEKGSKIFVDDIPVEKIQKVNDNANTLIIDNIFPGEYELRGTIEGGEDVKVKFNTDNGVGFTFLPKKEVLKTMSDLVKGYHNALYSKQDTTPYLTTTTGVYPTTGYKLVRIDNVTFDTTNAQTRLLEVGKITAKANLTIYTEKDTTDWFGKVTTQTNTKTQTIDVNFQQVDGKWKISSISPLNLY